MTKADREWLLRQVAAQPIKTPATQAKENHEATIADEFRTEGHYSTRRPLTMAHERP